VTFPLLATSWPHGQVSRLYGVFRETDGISDRALYFIDEAGVIRDSESPRIPPFAPASTSSSKRSSGSRGRAAKRPPVPNETIQKTPIRDDDGFSDRRRRLVSLLEYGDYDVPTAHGPPGLEGWWRSCRTRSGLVFRHFPIRRPTRTP